MINISRSLLLTQVNSFFPLSNNNSNAFSYYFPGCSNNIFNNIINICPICLSPLAFKKGRPNTCYHIFCLNCIQIWSKKKKVCPLCRKSFLKLIII